MKIKRNRSSESPQIYETLSDLSIGVLGVLTLLILVFLLFMENRSQKGDHLVQRMEENQGKLEDLKTQYSKELKHLKTAFPKFVDSNTSHEVAGPQDSGKNNQGVGKESERLEQEHEDFIRKINESPTMALKWKEIVALAHKKHLLQSRLESQGKQAFENRGGVPHLTYTSSPDSRFLTDSESRSFYLKGLKMSPKEFFGLTNSFEIREKNELSFFFEYKGKQPKWVKEITSDWEWVPANPKLK